MRRRHGEQPELAVVHGFLGGIGEYGPGVVDERKGMAGKGKEVVARVEEESEAAVLGGDVVDVGGVAEDLEDPVPISVVVVNPRLAGEERVDHREEVLRGLVSRVGLARAYRKGTRAVQVTRTEELVGRVKPALSLSTVSAGGVHGGSNSWKRKLSGIHVLGSKGSFVISWVFWKSADMVIEITLHYIT